MNQTNIIAILLIFALVLGLVFIGGKTFKDKLKTEIIQEMKRDYAPGPYAPGFDPDKVDPNFFRNRQQRQPDARQSMMYDGVPQRVPYFEDQGQNQSLPSVQDWNKLWEEQRY